MRWVNDWLVVSTDYSIYDVEFVDVESYTSLSTFLLQHEHFLFNKQQMQIEIMIKGITPAIT